MIATAPITEEQPAPIRICAAHDRAPADRFDRDGSPCYGDLWACTRCTRQVCAGSGSATSTLCDDCWWETAVAEL